MKTDLGVLAQPGQLSITARYKRYPRGLRTRYYKRNPWIEFNTCGPG